MAIRPSNEYPLQTVPPSPSYPYGQARNISAPLATDGTPLEEKWVNDLFGLFQSLLQESGIVPNDLVDTAQSSQYFQALQGLNVYTNINDVTNLRGYEPTKDGQVIYLKGHTVEGKGGGLFRYDAADVTTPDDNGFTIVTTLGSNRWKRIADKVYVSHFGAIGDGVTDDTQAFIDTREYWKTQRRSNPAPGANPNNLSGTSWIHLPAGDYLITGDGVLMDSGYTVRTVGMGWRGEGAKGSAQILFQPSTPSVLYNNNNSILGSRFENIVFNGNSVVNCIFMNSFANGGAQDFGYIDCGWSGQWKYGSFLEGVNNNSEHFYHNCDINGIWDKFIDSTSSDQFLNFWFSECKPWTFTGVLMNMVFGGSIRIKDCDFSNFEADESFPITYPGNGATVNFATVFDFAADHQAVVVLETVGGDVVQQLGVDYTITGAGTRASGTITMVIPPAVGESLRIFRKSTLFNLLGRTHAQGVCLFKETGSRYETQNFWSEHSYCEWPQGNYIVSECDESSGSVISGSETWETRFFDSGNTTGPIITFEKSQLIGKHKYLAGNSAWPLKRIARYQDCFSTNYTDFPDMIDSDLTTGSNRAGQWYPLINNCIGRQQNVFTAYPLWQPTTAYALDDFVISQCWVYKCITAGTSGTTPPTLAGNFNDGSVVWEKQDIFFSQDYITNGFLLDPRKQRNGSSGKFYVNIGRNIATGNFLISDGVDNNHVRAILPKNAVITGIFLEIPSGAMPTTSAATFSVFTDEVSPTTFFTVTDNNPSNGVSASFTGYYYCGDDIEARSIIFQSQNNVVTNISDAASCWIEGYV